MVVFKENYDLTRRTPTPPAQRRQRELTRKRQQDRDKHQAYQRGQFEAKRRLTQYIESQRARGGDTRVIPDLNPSSHTAHGGNDDFNISSGISMYQQQQPFGHHSPTGRTVSFGNTASIRGGGGFLSLANQERNVHPWTLDVPAVSNDSFSGFLGAEAREALDHARNLATSTVLDSNSTLNEDMIKNQQQQRRTSASQKNNSMTKHRRFSGIPEVQLNHSGTFSDSGDIIGFPTTDNANKNTTSGSRTFNNFDYFGEEPEHNRLFFVDDNNKNNNNTNNNAQPPCGFDTLDEKHQNELFEGEKRMTGEDHFEQYNFTKSADEIRVAATVKEFQRLVVDNPKVEQYLKKQNTVSSPTRVNPRFATPGGKPHQQQASASNPSSMKLGDPKDQQHVIEGLLGATDRLTAPTNTELETIRILKSTSNNVGSVGSQQQQRFSARRPSSARFDPLARRLAAGVHDSKRRQRNNESVNNSNSRSRRNNSPQDDDDDDDENYLHHQYVSPAASAVPRPPPDYYKSVVSARCVRQAEEMEEEKRETAAQLRKEQKEDPNPLHHRPPFRLKSSNSPSKHNASSWRESKRIREEKELEEDIREDIRLFEWRKAAQEHATQQARVAVTREKEIEAFRRRQAEHFKDALARFEPGALQRAEKAIQHRIAHELVAKYGPSQFVVSAKNSSTEKDDIMIPVPYQVCAREAAIAAAETARNEKMILKSEIEQQKQKNIAEMMERSSRLTGKKNQFSASSNKSTTTNNHPVSSQQQTQQQKLTPRRPQTANSILARHAKTQLAATRGLAVQKKEYVPRDTISSSGYKSWGGSIFPKGVTACETDDNEKFVQGAKDTMREIAELEARCPSLNLIDVKKPKLERKESIVGSK